MTASPSGRGSNYPVRSPSPLGSSTFRSIFAVCFFTVIVTLVLGKLMPVQLDIVWVFQVYTQILRPSSTEVHFLVRGNQGRGAINLPRYRDKPQYDVNNPHSWRKPGIIFTDVLWPATLQRRGLARPLALRPPPGKLEFEIVFNSWRSN